MLRGHADPCQKQAARRAARFLDRPRASQPGRSYKLAHEKENSLGALPAEADRTRLVAPTRVPRRRLNLLRTIVARSRYCEVPIGPRTRTENQAQTEGGDV